MADWIRATPVGVRFDVRLTPSAGANGFQGLATDAAGAVHLKARVTAIPENNKANAALVALIAKSLKVAKGAVTIVAGQTSRLKSIEVAGAADDLARRLEALARV